MKLPRCSAITFVALFAVASIASAELRLGSLFTDHMVLQREVECPIWGTCDPSSAVNVLLDGQPAAATTSDARGAFRVKLPAVREPGPHRIEVRSGDDVVTLSDVLAGEVWICSGQSNMEFPTTRAVNGLDEAAGATTRPTIRFYQVPKRPATQPSTAVDAKWTLASPETAGAFSAVGYFFGRTLHRELNVPIGLIHSSWSGTPAESWTPLETLKQLPLPKAHAMAVNVDASQLPDAAERFRAATLQWMEQTRQVDPGISAKAQGWADSELDTSSDWKPVTFPADMVRQGVPSGSITWLRNEMDVPPERAGSDLVLTLGIVDDFDTTFFNGEKVGATDLDTPGWWAAQRRYVVPGKLVKAGRNVIAIRVTDLDGPAGLTGPAPSMRATFSARADTPNATTQPFSIALTGNWQYRVERSGPTGVRPLRPLPPYKLDSAWTPGTLYNGMIAPVGSYAIRGAIWYQGESNAVRFEEYEPLLTAMIGSWREQFAVGDFPFYIVGLANWRAPTDDPNAFSDWAGLREAQRQISRTVKNTAMSVTIDIGDPLDIHPRNKQEVGRRLGLIALHDTYRREVVSRGPTLKRADFAQGRVVLSFDNVGGGLIAKADPLVSFSVAGEDGKFVWADARIENDSVVVSTPAVPEPTRIRYAWADNPTASLFNKEGLPAEPFQATK